MYWARGPVATCGYSHVLMSKMIGDHAGQYGFGSAGQEGEVERMSRLYCPVNTVQNVLLAGADFGTFKVAVRTSTKHF
jgi:hypothetical protein